MSLTFRKNIKKIDKSQWEDHLKAEKERLSTKRSQESDEEIELRRIADASRHVDVREEEGGLAENLAKVWQAQVFLGSI